MQYRLLHQPKHYIDQTKATFNENTIFLYIFLFPLTIFFLLSGYIILKSQSAIICSKPLVKTFNKILSIAVTVSIGYIKQVIHDWVKINFK